MWKKILALAHRLSIIWSNKCLIGDKMLILKRTIFLLLALKLNVQGM